MSDRRCEAADRVEGVLDHVPPVYGEAYDRMALFDVVREALGVVRDDVDTDAIWDALQEVTW